MEFTCETSALADAARNAGTIAPTKGEAFDKAQGIVIQLEDDEDVIQIKTSDLSSTYLQRIKVDNLDRSRDTVWRLPSALLANFLIQLPLNGAEVKFSQDGHRVKIQSGRIKASFDSLVMDGFPEFKPFDTADMSQVDNLARCMKQVAWAVGDTSPLNGIHLDGTSVVGCSQERMAEVPCTVPVDEAITVPLSALSAAIKNTSEVHMRASDDRLYLRTDEDTLMTSSILVDKYPNLDVLRAMAAKCDAHAEVSISAVSDAVSRMLVLCKTDRYPRIVIAMSPGAMSISMDVPDLGQVEETLDIIGAEKEQTFHFTPRNLMSALGSCHASGDKAWIGYNSDNDLAPIHFTDDQEDGKGFSCVCMPRRPE